MNFTEAIFLGLLQGATEFLPVSSSGHLVLAEYFMDIPQGSLAFDVTLHLGTLLAVLLFFRREWLDMARACLCPDPELANMRRLAVMVAVGTVPGALLGFLLEDLAQGLLRNPWIVVGTLSSVALLMAGAERLARHLRDLEKAGLRDGLLIGCSQALALIPGVSRSGITMTTGLFLGLTRTGAARFSFLLSAPIIAGAGLYEGIKLFKTGGLPNQPFFFWGFAASAGCGYLVISFLMRYLERHTFYPFVVYRLALAAAVAVGLIWGGP